VIDRQRVQECLDLLRGRQPRERYVFGLRQAELLAAGNARSRKTGH
jgi:hypothetical protein